MMTTFVRSVESRTKGVWRLLVKASWVDIRLAELKHPSVKKALTFCSGRVPVYVHPSLYWALKLKYSLDVGCVLGDDRVTTELSKSSQRHAVGILTSEEVRMP